MLYLDMEKTSMFVQSRLHLFWKYGWLWNPQILFWIRSSAFSRYDEDHHVTFLSIFDISCIRRVISCWCVIGAEVNSLSEFAQWAVGMMTTSEWTEAAFPLWHNNTHSPHLHKTHTHSHTVGHKHQQSFSCPLTLSKTHTHTRVTKSLHVNYCVAVVSGSREWVGENETYNRSSVPLPVPHLSFSCSVLSFNKFQSFYEFFNHSENGTEPFNSIPETLAVSSFPCWISLFCFSGSERNHQPRSLQPLWPGAGGLRRGDGVLGRAVLFGLGGGWIEP